MCVSCNLIAKQKKRQMFKQLLLRNGRKTYFILFCFVLIRAHQSEPSPRSVFFFTLFPRTISIRHSLSGLHFLLTLFFMFCVCVFDLIRKICVSTFQALSTGLNHDLQNFQNVIMLSLLKSKRGSANALRQKSNILSNKFIEVAAAKMIGSISAVAQTKGMLSSCESKL